MNWADCFYYDTSSPSYLRWKIDIYCGRNLSILKIRAGDVAGGLCKSTGYYVVGRYRKQYLAHRIVWELFNGEIKDESIIDHINGITTDNMLNNLRLTTQVTNMRNQKKFSPNTSGVSGVSFDTKSGRTYWAAHWYENGKVVKKAFSIAKFGEEAFDMACTFRTTKLLEIGGYSDRHGK